MGSTQTVLATGTSFEALSRGIRKYFEEFSPSFPLDASSIVGYLEFLAAEGTHPDALSRAWTHLELFTSFLESLPVSRPLEELQPWEFSRFLFEHISAEVYDPESSETRHRRELLSTLVSFYDYLLREGVIEDDEAIRSAYDRIYGTGREKRIKRPPLRAGDVVGQVAVGTSGKSHPIKASDLWLIAVLHADFHGQWNLMLEHLQKLGTPEAEEKESAVKHLQQITADAGVDLRDSFPTRGQKTFLEKARRWFAGR